jgi:hypothetical protein
MDTRPETGAAVPGPKDPGCRPFSFRPLAGLDGGKRDRAILAPLVGCGLRRGAAVALTVGDIQQHDGRWSIVGLRAASTAASAPWPSPPGSSGPSTSGAKQPDLPVAGSCGP